MEIKENYKRIYENENVYRWYLNSRAGAATTADMMRRNLALYCEATKTDPDSILNQAKDGTLKNIFQDFSNEMINKGRKGAYIGKIKQALNSYIRFHEINYKINIKIKNENKNETTEDEQVPKPEEVVNLIFKANPRGKVSISLMAYSGIRPEVLGSYEGKDGLVLGDIEDLDIGKLEFTKKPAKINIRSSLSKTDNRYFTFLNEKGCGYIIEYLRERSKRGEKLGPDSPLLKIDSRGGYASGYNFLRTLLVSREIRDVIIDAGFYKIRKDERGKELKSPTMRPYVLRAYFSTAMDRAEYNGLISHSWRQFFMGHKGDMEATYSTNKRLPPEQIEEMRSAYLKASKFLEPAEAITKDDVESLEKSFTARSLKWFGFSDAEIKEMVNLSDDDLQKRIQERRGMSMNNGRRQKVISIGDVESFIEQGWEYVNSLPGDKAIIRVPDHS